jgi:hypothetical protein
MVAEVSALRGENERLTEFAAACKVTIENLTALLRQNGFAGDDDGPAPSQPT